MEKFEELHLRNGAKTITRIPGPQSEKLLAYQEKNEGSIVSYPKSMPFAIRRAKGCIVEDVDGNFFIDFFSFAGVVNVGHCNQHVLGFVEEQQQQLVHGLDFPTQNKMELMEQIRLQIPEKLRDQYKISFCSPSGADAIEAAIKLAKHFTQREGLISFHGSYHGMTSAALSATSNIKFKENIQSIVPNVHFVPYSYCYRCPFSRDENTCALDCAKYLENILDNPHSGIKKPAAILLEPIQGEGGIITPKKGYLKKIVSIAKKFDIPVIFDEIQAGFFRTGKFWSFESDEFFPDIITISKGLGGVGFPISAIIYNKNIESWGTGDHVGTFRANQVSIAAGRGAFDFIERNNLEQHAQEMGEYLMKCLLELQNKYPVIGEVRGKGLFVGIEYVKDLKTKKPDPEIVQRIRRICLQHGLLFEIGGHYGNVIRFIPPLTINKTIIDNAISIFDKANESVCLIPVLAELQQSM